MGTMAKERSGDLSGCWAVMFLLLAFYYHLVASQPSYFKVSLPGKSLPRIGRRSGSDAFPSRPSTSSASSGSLDGFAASNSDAWNDIYTYSTPNIPNNNNNNNPNSNFNYNYNPHPDAVLLLRKYLADRERDGNYFPQESRDSLSLQSIPSTSAFYTKLQDTN